MPHKEPYKACEGTNGCFMINQANVFPIEKRSTAENIAKALNSAYERGRAEMAADIRSLLGAAQEASQ